MIEEACFFFFFKWETSFLRHFKEKGRKSNLSKNSKQVFGRGKADKWKETSCLQLQNQYPDWVNKSGWSQKNLRVEKKIVTNDRHALLFQITPHTLMEGDEKAIGVRGVWGALVGVSRSPARAGTVAGSRGSLPGFQLNTTAEQLGGLTDLTFLPVPSPSHLQDEDNKSSCRIRLWRFNEIIWKTFSRVLES